MCVDFSEVFSCINKRNLTKMSLWYIKMMTLVWFVAKCRGQHSPSDIRQHTSMRGISLDLSFPRGNNMEVTLGREFKIPVSMNGFTRAAERKLDMFLLFCSPLQACVNVELENDGDKRKKGDMEATLQEEEEYGTWTVSIGTKAISEPAVMLGNTHINPPAEEGQKAEENVLWCKSGEIQHYLSFSDRPICPRAALHNAEVEHGVLTVMKPNIKSLEIKAYGCSLQYTKVKSYANWFSTHVSRDGPYHQSVPIETCRRWLNDKACEYGTLEPIHKADGSSESAFNRYTKSFKM